MALPKNKVFLTAIVVAVFGVLAFAGPVFAQELGIVATMLSSLAQIIIELVGKLLIVLIEILLAVVKYNDFINAPAVDRGWILVRDVANMAFLIIFIAIAFATILGVEKYEWKRLLPKLLIMAVAINFSKTICGIIIDAAQVVMITFVNGFKDVAAGNLIRGFGLNDMLAIRDLGADENVTDTAVAAASILAVILLVIAAVTVGVIVLMFLVRIMFLWILIILSPLAFIMAATPGAENQFQKWFQQLIKYAFVGPIMAFFLWLSFSIMAGVAPGSNLAQDSKIFRGASKTGITEPAGNTSAAISGISRSDQLLSYAIAIALLLLSLSVANSLGVAGGSIAGKALDKIKSGGVKLGKLAALGVATGGVGAPLALLGGKGAYKGGKGVYKGAKKLGLTGMAGRALDTKYGGKVTQLGGKILSKFGPTKEARAIGKAYGRDKDEEGKPIEGIRLSDVKKTYLKFKERKEKEEFSIPNAAVEDQLNREVRGRDTNRVFETMVALAQERQKELPEDEDAQVRLFQKAEQEMQSKDEKTRKGAEIDWLASYMALKDNNGDNTMLTTTAIANPVVKEALKRMGGLEDEGVEKYNAKNADGSNAKDSEGNDLQYTEIEEEYEKSRFRDSGLVRNLARRRSVDLASRQAINSGLDLSTKAGKDFVSSQSEAMFDGVADEVANENWDRNKNGIMLKWAQDYAKKSAEEKSKTQEEIGTRLYAQKYNLYEFKNGKVAGYAKQIFDANGNITAHAGRLDEEGVMQDEGVYEGSADAFHEQTLQMVDAKHLQNANPMLSDDIVLQLGRELDGMALKNKSYGLAMKNKIKKDGTISRINLATKSGEKEH
ncbi:MAG: hypothetical protein QF747_03005, partial [Patescibacteria group bacterium]|nr:hypothetical protein [Patescibacteria group bacterium]